MIFPTVIPFWFYHRSFTHFAFSQTLLLHVGTFVLPPSPVSCRVRWITLLFALGWDLHDQDINNHSQGPQMNLEAELQQALLPKDTGICPHPEQFSPLWVKILETPSGSSPTPQFLTFLAAPSAAQLSPWRTRCHQLFPFFHPVSFGARKLCFGGRRPVASTLFTTTLWPNHDWVTLPRGLISHQPFRFDVISPFSKPCSTPGLQILISLGGDRDAQPNLDQINLVPAARSRLPAHPRPGSAAGSSGKPVAGRDAAQRHRKKPRGTRGGQFRLCRESFRRDLCSASLSLLLPIPGRG